MRTVQYCSATSLRHLLWDILGSYYNIPKAIFDLLKGDYRVYVFKPSAWLGFSCPKPPNLHILKPMNTYPSDFAVGGCQPQPDCLLQTKCGSLSHLNSALRVQVPKNKCLLFRVTNNCSAGFRGRYMIIGCLDASG